MQDEINQKVSQFLDDELFHNEALELLTEIKKQPELDAKLQRYEMASAILKNNRPIIPRADFSKNISDALEQEVVYFLPQRKPRSKYIKPALALAAGVAGVAVLVTNNVIKLPDNNAQPIVVASVIPKQQAQALPLEAEKIVVRKSARIDPRFNNYLQAHRGNLYTIDSGVQSYATLAGYGQ